MSVQVALVIGFYVVCWTEAIYALAHALPVEDEPAPTREERDRRK